MRVSVDSILGFLGGLFILIAAVLPLWQRAIERGYKYFLRSLVFVIIELILCIGGLVMLFVFKNAGVAALLFAPYLIVAAIEFSLRPFAIQRGELAFFVLWVAATCSFVVILILIFMGTIKM